MLKLLKDVGNLLILIVLNIVPIVNFIVLGYFSQVVRHDHDDPPRISDFGMLFVEGLKLVIAVLIYAIVPLLVIFLGAGLALLAAFTHPYRYAVGPAVILSLAIGFLLLLVLLFIGMPALALFMRTGDFGKIFAFGEAWELITRLGLLNYIIFYIVLIVFNFLVGFVGSLIPWVGTFILGVFSMAFTFKALSLFVNLKYQVLPPPPPPPPLPSFG